MPNAIKKIGHEIDSFRRMILDFYKKNGRELPWRTNTDPYWILISEIMLQQTQVPRALIKFPEFISRFPTIQDLAAASIPDVLSEWQGLGYNRRALFLKRTAELIVTHHVGVVPNDIETLKRLPGIGPNTAASIVAFAYNIPYPFIETNIRTVFLHHFFNGKSDISDAALMPLIAAALDKKNTRRWHWALMDYGTFLKKTTGNASRQSRHYTKQTKFEGSLRQVRGLILKTLLTQTKPASVEKISKLIDRDVSTTQRAIDQLFSENFLGLTRSGYSIKN